MEVTGQGSDDVASHLNRTLQIKKHIKFMQRMIGVLPSGLAALDSSRYVSLHQIPCQCYCKVHSSYKPRGGAWVGQTVVVASSSLEGTPSTFMLLMVHLENYGCKEGPTMKHVAYIKWMLWIAEADMKKGNGKNVTQIWILGSCL